VHRFLIAPTVTKQSMSVVRFVSAAFTAPADGILNVYDCSPAPAATVPESVNGNVRTGSAGAAGPAGVAPSSSSVSETVTVKSPAPLPKGQTWIA